MGERNGKARALFVCTHNSARSQMAEGLLRHLAGDRFEAFWAGTEATRVRPEAISTMNDLRIDISGQESKTLEPLPWEPFDYVITVCDEANEACPFFPPARKNPALVAAGSVPGRRRRRGVSGGLSGGEGPPQGPHRWRSW
jgi:arsenate reductase